MRLRDAATADCIFQGQEPTNARRDTAASPEHCADTSAQKGAAPDPPPPRGSSAQHRELGTAGSSNRRRNLAGPSSEKPARGPSIRITPVFVALQPEEDVRELGRDLGGGTRMIDAAEGAAVRLGEVIRETQME